MEDKFFSVYDLIATHRNRWISKECEARGNGDYNNAQSYKDMAYAAEALLIELQHYGFI